jgi:glycosyltransferase involved in cell wall biosynthesis
MNKLRFSVFTPVYNRKHTIHRVWESLVSQTYRDFEWIVVDDGSSDGIESILLEYKAKAFFPVTILHQSNQGKHIAWNRAVEIAIGEIFVPADSDDAFVPETLEIFLRNWLEIPENKRDGFSGINVLCIDSTTREIIGNQFPESPFVSNNLDLIYLHKISGEKWGCIRTDCLRLRKNPEIQGTHMPEGWIWFWLARRFKVLCINIPLRIYYQNEAENISSKIGKETHLKRLKINYVFLCWNLTDNIDYIIKYEGIISIIKKFMILWKESFYLKTSPFTVMSDLGLFWPRLFAVITIIPGFSFYLLSIYQNK